MLRLRTFGGLTLELDGAPCTGPATQRRRLALLALLAASDAGVARERLRSYLWPETAELGARHALDDALSALRRELRCPGLVLGVTTLRLNPEHISSDLADLGAAMRAGDAETAAALCTGPFLDGFVLPDARDFEWWVEAERLRRSQAHERVLDGLASAAAARGDTAAAVGWCQARAALDRLDTPATLGLIAALAAHGRMHEALRVAGSHERFVRQEFDAAPSLGWTAIVANLRRQVAPPSATAAASVVFR